MIPLLRTLDAAGNRLTPLAPGLLPLFARLAFAAVLLRYFWASAATKLGTGITGLFLPSDGAYAQIFPKAFEAVGYDSSQLGLFHWAVTLGGMWAEIILPLCLVLGFLTRPVALGLIGFVVVQSLTDVFGHGADAATIGGWFDRDSGALILDQRLLWMFLLSVPLFLGSGWLSVDRVLRNSQAA